MRRHERINEINETSPLLVNVSQSEFKEALEEVGDKLEKIFVKLENNKKLNVSLSTLTAMSSVVTSWGIVSGSLNISLGYQDIDGYDKAIQSAMLMSLVFGFLGSVQATLKLLDIKAYEKLREAAETILVTFPNTSVFVLKELLGGYNFYRSHGGQNNDAIDDNEAEVFFYIAMGIALATSLTDMSFKLHMIRTIDKPHTKTFGFFNGFTKSVASSGDVHESLGLFINNKSSYSAQLAKVLMSIGAGVFYAVASAMKLPQRLRKILEKVYPGFLEVAVSGILAKELYEKISELSEKEGKFKEKEFNFVADILMLAWPIFVLTPVIIKLIVANLSKNLADEQNVELGLSVNSSDEEKIDNGENVLDLEIPTDSIVMQAHRAIEEFQKVLSEIGATEEFQKALIEILSENINDIEKRVDVVEKKAIDRYGLFASSIAKQESKDKEMVYAKGNSLNK